MRDDEFAMLVNDLRDIAIQYHDAGQLRERIRNRLVTALRCEDAASPAALTDERIEAIWDSTQTAETGEEMRRRFARALLAASPADQVGWIPVSERLPDEAGEYLVYRPDAHRKPAADPNTCIREYTPSRRPTADGWGGAHRVTHWMPLPSAPMSATPPEEGKQNG